MAGGAKRAELEFNRTNAGMSAGMLALAVVALVLPGALHSVHPEAAARLSELRMSEAVAVILIATYGLLAALHAPDPPVACSAAEPHPIAGPVWSAARRSPSSALATVGVAVESELLVHAATEATATLGFRRRSSVSS